MDLVNKKRSTKYDRVMSRLYNRSRSTVESTSNVTRHRIPSSTRVGAKASSSNLSSGVFSELPVVLNDYVPEAPVKKTFVVKPRRTIKSLDPAKSPQQVVRPSKPVVHSQCARARGSAPSVLYHSANKWSDDHYRECLSSRSHTRVKELKNEIQEYQERDKLMKLRSRLYKSCGVVLDDVGHVAQDKAVQAEPPPEIDKESEKLRRKIWLDLIQRPDLDRPNLKPRSYFVCALHFADSVISRQEIVKLLPNSIPTKFLDCTGPPTNTLNALAGKNKKRHLNRRNIWTQTDDTEPYLPSAARVPAQTETWSNISTQSDAPSTSAPTTQNKSKTSSSETNEDALSKRKMTVGFYKLMQWQITLKNKYKGDYNSAEFKKFALEFYYSSPQAYRTLKTFLKLPDECVLSRSNLNIRSGLDDWMLKSISAKLQSLPEKARYCTMCIAETTLRQHLYYDIRHDEIIGLHNMYGKVSNEVASNAYVVMLRGIAVKWDLPVAYALVASNQDQRLYAWIDEIITKLSSLGISVMAIVTDQKSQFVNYAKDLKNITTEKPYFTVSDHKIYYIFDVPDLLKCVRNNLLSYDFYTLELDRISWEHIKMLYTVQKERYLQLMPKITDAHIVPNSFDKKEVKLAAQVFSLSVYGALNTFITSKFLPKEARATAEFVKVINDLYDVLNSSNESQESTMFNEHQLDILDTAVNMFQSLTAIDKETSNFKGIPIFENFQITIQAMKMLSKTVKKQDINHFFPQRFSQEPVENWFNEIRLQKPAGRDPYAIQFRRAFSKFFNFNMIQNASPNDCHDDLSSLLLTGDEILTKTMDAIEHTQNFMTTRAMVSLDGEMDYRFDLPSDGAPYYVAAYLLYKCSQKHQCQQLTTFMKNRMYLFDHKSHRHFKELNQNEAFYGHLKLPPEYFVSHVKKLEKMFIEKFEKFSLQNPGTILMTVLETLVIDFPCSCFPKKYLIKLYL